MAFRSKKIKPNGNSAGDIILCHEESENSLSSAALSMSQVQHMQRAEGKLLHNAGKTLTNATGHQVKAFMPREPPSSTERCFCVQGYPNTVLLYVISVISIATLVIVILAVLGMINVCTCPTEGNDNSQVFNFLNRHRGVKNTYTYIYSSRKLEYLHCY